MARQIFTELSPNQVDAVGKPCTTCNVGTFRRIEGKYGPFVSCSRYPACDTKVYRPRGRHVESGAKPEVKIHTEAWAEKGELPPEENREAIDTKVETSDQDTNESPESEMSGIEAAIVAVVERRINAKVEKALGSIKLDPDAIRNTIIEELAKVRSVVIEIKREDKETKTVEGAHYLMPRLIRLISAGIPVYLWGPAGSGKTTAAMQASHALSLDSEIDTLDPSTFRSMVQGYCTPQGEPVHTSFTRCWSSGKVYIADECDNAPGHVQTLFNSALANGHAPLAWGNVERAPEGFGFVGTGNTPGRPTREFPDRKPMSAAFADRLYFMHWPLDPAIECRAGGLSIPVAPERKEVVVTAAEWVIYVQRMREWARENMPTLMITPRASLVGLKALSLGETPLEVAHALIFRGADGEMVNKALNAVKLPGSR
jgi:ssDNA-binding Zn-finger/Zn-ribbon topoisomerase 1